MQIALTASSRIVLAAFIASSFLPLTGCGSSPAAAGSITTAAAPLAAGGASSIFVEEETSTGAQTILQYPATSSGSLNPTTTLNIPSTMDAESIATDASGQLYVGGVINGSTYEILVYAAGSTGSAAPTRTILENPVSIAVPSAMAIDSSGQIYVTGWDSTFTYGVIAVYSATANGTSTPLQYIKGTSTQLAQEYSIAVDSAKNIYVANTIASASGSILVFSSGATGNVVPTRTITIPSTVYGVLVDASSNIYVTTDNFTYTNNNISNISSSIVEYAAGATGAAAPIKTISGSATDLNIGVGMRMDSAGNIYVVDGIVTSYSAGTTTFALLGFGPTATGNEPPAVNITSSAWNDAGSQLALH